MNCLICSYLFGKFFEKSIEKCMGLELKFDSVGNHELIALD